MVTMNARTNHTEVYISMGTPLWKMEHSCSLFLMRNQAKHMKICIPPQLKLNSVSLKRTQCVGHHSNSVWKKTDTRRKSCKGWSNALENLPRQSVDDWNTEVTLTTMDGNICYLHWHPVENQFEIKPTTFRLTPSNFSWVSFHFIQGFIQNQNKSITHFS